MRAILSILIEPDEPPEALEELVGLSLLDDIFALVEFVLDVVLVALVDLTAVGEIAPPAAFVELEEVVLAIALAAADDFELVDELVLLVDLVVFVELVLFFVFVLLEFEDVFCSALAEQYKSETTVAMAAMANVFCRSSPMLAR